MIQRNGMGGNSPSRFSAEDEGGGGGVTFVKGIRLSDRVISRMKQSSKPSCPHFSPDPQTTPVPAPSVENVLPLLTPNSPAIMTTPPTSTQDAVLQSPSDEATPPGKLTPPPPVKFHSFPPPSLDFAAPPPSLETKTPSQDENPKVPESLTPPSSLENVVLPPPESFTPSHKEPETQTAPQAEEPLFPDEVSSPSEPSSLSCEFVKPTPTEPALESVATPSSQTQTVEVSASVTSPPVKAVISPSPLATASAKTEASSPETEAAPAVKEAHSPLPPSPPEPPSDEASLSCHTPPDYEAPAPTEAPPIAAEPPVATFPPPAVENEEHDTEPSPTAALPISPGEVEEKLREKIRAEMQKRLEEEMNQKKRELQQQLKEMQALTRAEATGTAQANVEEQVKKTLEASRAVHMEKLTESVAREKMKAEDGKLMVQLYLMELKAHQLEEMEKEMKKRDELYKEHVSKLEAKCAEFYKVSADNFQKGKEETQKRFARFNIQPLCGDLQGQILKCYKENPGRTLTCSGIASAYMQCVDNAKKDKLITRG